MTVPTNLRHIRLAIPFLACHIFWNYSTELLNWLPISKKKSVQHHSSRKFRFSILRFLKDRLTCAQKWEKTRWAIGRLLNSFYWILEIFIALIKEFQFKLTLFDSNVISRWVFTAIDEIFIKTSVIAFC